MPKQLVIITKFFLPQASVDSTSVYQMIAGILKVDPTIDIHVVTSDTRYKAEWQEITKNSNYILENITVHRVISHEARSISLITLLTNLLLGYKLVVKAKSLGIKNIISLSNPPLVAMWSTWLLEKFNFFYWTFDLFPDAFVADELISRQNPLFRIFEWLTYKNPPSVLICLGDYQYSYVSRKFGFKIPYIKLPAGVYQPEATGRSRPDWYREDVIVVGYVGNIGRAHSLPFLINVISELATRSEYLLVLAIYGHHREAVLEHVNNLKATNVILLEHVKKEDLVFIDIHLVSLKQSWNNISVPSKAVSAVCSGGILWYCGPADSDTGQMFKECSYISFEDINSIRNTLQQISSDDIQNKKKIGLVERNKLVKFEESAYSDIVTMIYKI